MRRSTQRILILLTLVTLAGLVFLPLVDGEKIFRTERWIDLNSGRMRTQNWLLDYCLSERIEETRLSRELPASKRPPRWRMVDTSLPLPHAFICHRYGGVLSQARMVSHIVDWEPGFTAEARHKVFRNLLLAWQTSGSSSGGYDYLGAVLRCVESRARSGPPITVEEVPDFTLPPAPPWEGLPEVAHLPN